MALLGDLGQSMGCTYPMGAKDGGDLLEPHPCMRQVLWSSMSATPAGDSWIGCLWIGAGFYCLGFYVLSKRSTVILAVCLK